MKIILPNNRVREENAGPSTIEQVLSGLNINPVEVLVAVNGRLVPEDAVVDDDDEIRIIRVAHGG